MGEIHPKENGLVGLHLFFEEIGRARGDVVVDRLHPLFGQRPGVFDLLRSVWIGEAVDHASRTEVLAEVGKFRIIRLRIIGKLRLFFGVEVIKVAVELVEPMRGRQHLILVAEVVLAELAGGIALSLQQFGDGWIFLAQTEIGTRQADFAEAGPEYALPGDEGRASCGAALFSIIISEDHPIRGDGVDVGRAVAHQSSNYPPAEPGALFSVSRSKRLEGDADASPAHCAT